jgi:hypothetical protein
MVLNSNTRFTLAIICGCYFLLYVIYVLYNSLYPFEYTMAIIFAFSSMFLAVQLVTISNTEIEYSNYFNGDNSV